MSVMRGGLREFVVIVAGVLAALAAQAWWESRQEREREIDYLRQMLADTRANEERLNGAIESDSLSELAARSIAAAVHGGASLPQDETFASLLGRAYSSPEVELRSGSYGSIIAAGDLRLIRNDSLRSSIVAYSASLQHVQQLLVVLLEQAFGDAIEIGRALPILPRLASADTDAGFARIAREQIPLEAWRENRDVAAVIFTIQIAHLNRLRQLRGLRADTEQLREILEAELDSAS